jgi:glycosyltransferase involved in cell wall biosynthesis
VPLGIDLAAFEFSATPLRRPVILLQVARLVPKKGVRTTIEAYALAGTRLGASELWIVGDGPERRELESSAHRHGVAEQVRFFGALPHADVRELMSQAHIGVQPSVPAPNGDREGTPTVILEMQALGVDVAATNHADIPFIVPFPERLVPEEDASALADELVWLANLTATARTARLEAARSLVEAQHDATRVAETMRTIYARAADTSARSPVGSGHTP